MTDNKEKNKVAFVIQRYGEEVNGGAERFCRHIAEKLKDTIELEVITTCSIDYNSWKNEYDEGDSLLNGVRLKRFKTDHKRNTEKQKKMQSILERNSKDIVSGLEWIRSQGPVSSDLMNYLKRNSKEYYRIVFYTYLYPPSFFGIQICPKKSILVPFAHDEPYLYYHIFRKIFQIPRGIIFQAPEERDLVQEVFANRHINHDVIGMGIEVDKGSDIDIDKFKKKNKLDKYILYAGRIDESKGCDELFDFFIRYKEEHDLDIDLVLTGKAIMDVPERDDIRYLGFVSEQDKFNAMAGAEALVNNSQYESFSIVLLESFLMKRPVLVNAKAKVMKGHVDRSGGGYAYENYDEFEKYLNKLLTSDSDELGEKGYKYVRENYTWKVIGKKWKNFLLN